MEDALRVKASEPVQSDIFAHTFVDYGIGEKVEEEMREEQPFSMIDRPPKDVFSFMNLNFDLPSAYYQAYGDFTAPNDH